jgi:hypothetical protein
MITRKTLAIFTMLFTTVLFCLAAPQTKKAQAPQSGCDRECLKGFVTKYLDALIAHKPEAVPVASNVKYTEDCKEIKLGEGIWKNITRLKDYRRDILDVRQGVAVSFLVVEEGSSPVLYVIRLKVENSKITEIESMAVHGQKEGMLFNTDNLKTVSPTMISFPDKAQLVARDEAIKMAVTYPEGLKIGSFVKVDSPMADDAYRFENGQLMAGPGCTFFQGCNNMKKQFIPTLAGITHRVVAVDEELGVVVVRMNFGPGSVMNMGAATAPGVLDVWHSFKIFGGQIHAAEAYCKVVPAGTPSGWDK